MSMSKVDRLKAMFKEEAERKEKNNNNSGFRNDVYPFWQMKNGETAIVRFLPDANEENPKIFFEDKLEHTLSLNGEDRKIPCLAMYGEECPICVLCRKYYKDEGKGSANGKYHYRKKATLVRILVLKDPLPADESGETYEGKVCMTQLGFQLMTKLQADIAAGAIDDVDDFTDYDNGYNFIIGKTQQGTESSYVFASGFERRPSAVPAQHRDNIELIALNTRLPQNPGYDKVMAMLTAYMTGDEYVDEDAEQKTEDKSETKSESPSKSTKPASKPAEVPVTEDVDDADEEEDAAEDVVETSEISDDDDDILAAIRRKKASKK